MRGQDLTSADMDVRKFIIRVAAETGDVLGENLAGLYVFGSLATGAFYRHASDIDFLILVHEPLAPAKRAALEKTLAALNGSRPTAGEIEVSVVQARHAKNYEHPLPLELQYNSKASAVPAQLMHVKQRAVRLTGAEPQDAIGLIPWHAFMDSVVSEFDAKGGKIEERPAAVVFNACRTLHDTTHPSIRILSKTEAAEWALTVVPEEYKPTIEAALEAHRTGAVTPLDADTIRRFRAYVEDAGRTAFDKVRDVDEE